MLGGMTGEHHDEPVRAPGLRQAIAVDFRTSDWRHRAALLAVALWMVYEWGPGNETVTPWLTVNVVGRIDGVQTIPITALIVFGFTTLQQLASGFTALAGFSMFERTSGAAWQRLRGNAETAPTEWSRLGWVTRGVVVFGLGTTAVALTQIMSTGVVGVKRHSRVIVQSAVLCGAVVGLLAALVASLAVIGRATPALEGATEWLLDVLGSPLLWLGIVVVGTAVHFVRRAIAGDDEPPAPADA
jgi:hypothetical protein